MTSIRKPTVCHPELPRNKLGLTVRDYEGVASTLCAGCGHDSITAALIQAFFEMDIAAEMVGKLSGIGCSSKSTAYFLRGSHGINAVHGRMPAIATGAVMARPDMLYIGISGDGDSLSIGLGQLCHAMRRNTNMVYIIENNGVYGLTKGQFSASADTSTVSRTGERNPFTAIDAVELALSLGATFVARGFSGHKEQLVPLLKAAFSHRGFALLDVISPCVTFNDHLDSTKSYMFTRQNYETVTTANFVPKEEEITAEVAPDETKTVRLHNGATLNIHCLAKNYDPTNLVSAQSFIRAQKSITTGLIYINPERDDLTAVNELPDTPLANVPFSDLCPGHDTLKNICDSYR